jgi:4-alpha-glucanotransferase
VAQYEIQPDGSFREPPANVVASLNTHDMPTFRGFWEGRDLAALHRLGLLDDETFAAERERRRARREGLARRLSLGDPDSAGSAGAALAALLAELGASRAAIVLVNLEDLWQEREPQNVPGTYLEHANWQRKARLTLEEMKASPEIAALLQRLDEQRRGRVGAD